MADGIPITPGSGVTVLTDETASGHAQGIKLAESANGSATYVDVGGLLTAIKTAVEIIDNMIAGSEAQVDIVTSALPSGAATSAKQDTIIGHVDGLEALLTTIDADTGAIVGHVDGLETLLAAIQTAAEAIEAAVEGTLTVGGSTTVSGTIGITKPAAAARTQVNSGTSNVTILASNANRLGATIFNDDANALLVGLGGTDVTSTNYTWSIAAGTGWEVPYGYTGIIEGLWAGDGSGAARVTELTAS
jgi:hypothetical protein